jgi:hypothetical protein
MCASTTPRGRGIEAEAKAKYDLNSAAPLLADSCLGEREGEQERLREGERERRGRRGRGRMEESVRRLLVFHICTSPLASFI